jgi:hypothetical protein
MNKIIHYIKKFKNHLITIIAALTSIGFFTFIQNEINKKDNQIQIGIQKIHEIKSELLSCRAISTNYQRIIMQYNDIIQDKSLIYNKILLKNSINEKELKIFQEDIKTRVNNLKNLQQEKDKKNKCSQKIPNEIISIQSDFNIEPDISKQSDMLSAEVDKLGKLFEELIILEKNRYVYYRMFTQSYYNNGLSEETLNFYQEYAALVQKETDKNQEIHSLEFNLFQAMKNEINKIELELFRRKNSNFLKKAIETIF